MENGSAKKKGNCNSETLYDGNENDTDVDASDKLLVSLSNGNVTFSENRTALCENHRIVTLLTECDPQKCCLQSVNAIQIMRNERACNGRPRIDAEREASIRAENVDHAARPRDVQSTGSFASSVPISNGLETTSVAMQSAAEHLSFDTIKKSTIDPSFSELSSESDRKKMNVNTSTDYTPALDCEPDNSEFSLKNLVSSSSLSEAGTIDIHSISEKKSNSFHNLEFSILPQIDHSSTSQSLSSSQEDIPDCGSEYLPDRAPENLTDRALEDLPDFAPEYLPDCASECLPECAPEILPELAPQYLSESAMVIGERIEDAIVESTKENRSVQAELFGISGAQATNQTADVFPITVRPYVLLDSVQISDEIQTQPTSSTSTYPLSFLPATGIAETSSNRERVEYILADSSISEVFHELSLDGSALTSTYGLDTYASIPKASSGGRLRGSVELVLAHGAESLPIMHFEVKIDECFYQNRPFSIVDFFCNCIKKLKKSSKIHFRYSIFIISLAALNLMTF